MVKKVKLIFNICNVLYINNKLVFYFRNGRKNYRIDNNN